MKTKADVTPERFWERVNFIAKRKSIKFKSLCDEWGITYKTIMSNRTRQELPSMENAWKIALALEVSLDSLLFGESSSHEQPDKLLKILSDNNDLKALVWRIAQCSTIQIRAIKTMLATWGIGEYDALGNSKAVASC